MDVRPLRDGEQTALLDLAGRWPAPDDYPMRALFTRYVEDDPRFDPRDVWVAEGEGGALVSCVQIFPRKLVIRGVSVPIGGIGTVFTHPNHRGGGIAASVMRAAMDDLSGRMELGLLFAGPVPFYEKLGWHSWPVQRPLLRPAAEADPGALAGAEPFEPARDLAEVQEIHASYSRMRDGYTARGPRDWWVSLRNAGHPHEEFRVAREGGRVVAYLRAVCLARFLVVMEWGRDGDAAGALAGLFAAALTPREDDPLAPEGKSSQELRSVASAVPLLDPALEAALAERGIESVTTEDRGGMFWVANAAALAHRFNEPWRTRAAGDLEPPGERERRLLARILPPSRFAFWVADRF